MLKLKMFSIVLSLFCATAGAGAVNRAGVSIREGMEWLNYDSSVPSVPKLSTEQEEILIVAVSTFVSQVDTEILEGLSGIGVSVSSEGVGVSAGFSVLKTSIRMNEGKAFLSIEGSLGGVGMMIDVEFGSLDDLFDSVGKSLVKTAKLVPYSYRRWVLKEDVDFNKYFDVFEDQRPFTIKAGGADGRMRTIYESRDSGLDVPVYEGPPITDFFGLPDSLNRLPWDNGKEDVREGSIDVDDEVALDSDPTPGLDPTPDPYPTPDPEPEPALDPAFVWGSGMMEGASYGDGTIQYVYNGNPGEYYFSWNCNSFEMYPSGDGFSGEVGYEGWLSLELGNPSPAFDWYEMWASFDADEVQIDPASDGYDYVKWGDWENPDIRFISKSNSPIQGAFVPFISGIRTPVEDVPTSGTATYLGDVMGERFAFGTASPISADLTLVANFSDSSIDGTFSNFRVGGVQTNSWDLDLDIVNGNFVGDMDNGSIVGSVAGTFVGPNAEEVMGGFHYKESFDDVYSSGFFAGKRQYND